MNRCVRIAALFLVIAIAMCGSGWGQARTAEPETVRIRKLHGLSNRSVVTSPVYSSNVGRSAKPPREWLAVQVVYDTAPEWIDELVIEYFVMMMGREGTVNTYSLFRRTVRYMDVERDRNHMGVAYLKPSALKRYGRVVAVAVELSHDGKVVAAESDTEIKLPAQWWKNPAVTESKSMTLRDGYLIDRMSSPFAYVNIDDYEEIK